MNRLMLGTALALLVLVSTLSSGVASAGAAPSGSAAPATPDPARVERGRYLVTFGGCNDCHTPWVVGENGPEPDMSRMLSGHPQQLTMPPVPPLPDGPWLAIASGTNTAWAGPWGVSFTRNLTPDPETGLGAWTEKEFIDTLRNGRERGIGREILPPMPWQGYGQATDEDLAAMYAYLRTIPAVSNRVPDNLPPAAPPAKE
jgi:mono/diheme cytochrome c family protein